jgi:hypothetical protein
VVRFLLIQEERQQCFAVIHSLSIMILIWFLKKSGLFEKKNEAGDVIQAAEPYILFVYPLSTVSDLPGQAF